MALEEGEVELLLQVAEAVQCLHSKLGYNLEHSLGSTTGHKQMEW